MRMKFIGLAVLSVWFALAVPDSAPAQVLGYYKLYRVVAVIPAPWTTAAAIAASSHALGRAGIAFLGNEVKAPPPLACAHADYSDFGPQDAPFDNLFAGRVPDDKVREVVKALGIEETDPFGLRVTCGAETTFFLKIHSTDFLVRAGDAILRLEPRENADGVDVDEWVRPITPGFDCEKASTATEKLICMDFDVARLDRTISQRYAALGRAVTETSFATIRATQRTWLRHIAKTCADGPLPDDWIARRDMTRCLQEAYQNWADAYETLSVAHVGGLSVEPRMHAIAAERPRSKLDLIVYPWMIGSPEATAAAFNALIKSRLAPEAAYLTGERVLEPGADYPISAWRRYAIDHADERTISMSIFGLILNGGTEGKVDGSIEFDMARAAIKR